MKHYIKYIILAIILSVPFTQRLKARNYLLFQQTNTSDTLRYPFKDYQNITDQNVSESPLHLENPSNIKDTTIYDPETNEYIISKKIGSIDYRPSQRMSLDEYQDYQFEQALRNYWRTKARGGDALAQSGLFPNLRLGGETFDKIFGNNAINIIPMGSAELIFKLNVNNTDNPTISENLRKTTTFDFEEKITMNVSGNIGDKIKLGVRYDTEATFDFENETKLEYVGKEDEIIKRIEAGNVSLPLPGSLITGSQSLFGIKTELQFGKLTVTGVFSQQKGETKVIEVNGGAQTQRFDLHADEYDANRHFFLSQYFREHYDEALENLPLIKSVVTITKVEVWITNKQNDNTDNRNILALLDLAEQKPFNTSVITTPLGGQIYPRNTTNDLYNRTKFDIGRDFNKVTTNISSAWGSYGFDAGEDYEKIGSARKLRENEYTLNSQLGYISLNFALNNDEILAVAYEYNVGGETFKVGDFSTDGISSEEMLIAKLIKGTTLTPSIPTWDLMMKNVYAIGGYQINSQDFILNILYQDDKTGNALNYIPEGKINKKILLKVMNLDELNSSLDAGEDGRFDFVDGVTVNSSNGRIIFPVLEPFGSHLREQFDNPTIADKYVFQELYDTTITYARLVAEKNKFKLRGEYRSDVSSEIPLNAINIPQGSVKVMAGGRQLTENVEYTVDYNLGRVKIIDAGLLESGTPLQISLESNALYSIQTKTLLGTHLNYQFSENFNVGATVMNLTERPLTQKVAIGEEPISNTIWGVNTSYQTESQFITSLVDKIPLIETKEKSSVLIDAEFAHLIPGHSSAIEEEGNAYIDDFEGSETSMDLKSNFSWILASTPYGQQDLFPEAYQDSLVSGFNRAKIAWYKIDPLFLRNNSLTPDHIKGNDTEQSNHFVREIYEKEIFPNKESETNVPTALQVLNLAFYPKERGAYNYETSGVSGFSRGTNPDGTLRDPESRWAGIMRETPNSDFEAANVNYIEFWVMDPFVYDPTKTTNGKLYFNIGSISEDILKDSRIAFEDGLPNSDVIENVDSTIWGRVPSNDYTVESFNNIPAQDIGLDGLKDDDEFQFFNDYIQAIDGLVTNETVKAQIIADPSNDNYHYFTGGDYDSQKLGILDRYKKYNGMEGNSGDKAYTRSPDSEDINGDKTLSETESYFQYEVDLSPEKMVVGQNYIVDKVAGYNVDLPDGTDNAEIYWYQFRIPIREPEKIVGAISDFKSIRFMRMFLKGFEDSIILRFAKLELVRGEWRKYELSLMEGQENLATPEYSNGSLDISSVNIEENDNYVLPPGVDRVIDPTNPQLRQLNEQSMVLKVKNLEDGDARAAYKTINLDMRQYKKLKMYVHANELENQNLNDNDLRIFVRLGTDYKDNYYEYELPIKVTQPGETSDVGVWPKENNVEINFSDLIDVKQARNKEIQTVNSVITYNSIYSVYGDNNERISVRGNPNLSNVVTIMIGVRNPSKQNNASPDDGMTKSGEIWVNELRLSDFKEDGGWAARGRISTRLADFGTVNLSGSISTPGFGSIEKKVNERSKEEIIEYDVSANLELGKFFPEKAKVSIPMYVGYSESFINPEYNPLDPDIPLQVALDEAGSKSARDSIKEIAQDYTQRKSINFTNVKINRSSKTPQIYDLSNFSISYSYNELFARNVNTEYDVLKNYRGAFNYIYNTRPKMVAPFRKANGLLRKKAFALIKDFNFYYMPSSVSFRTDVFRKYQASKTRNIYNPDNIIEPNYNKEFKWNRYYDLKWDLSRSLKLDFSATNIAIIDEPYGEVNRHGNDSVYSAWKSEVWDNVKDFGRNKQYNHNIKLTYRVPINKIPLLDWTSLNTTYNTTYNWEAGPLDEDGNTLLGNTVRNSTTMQANAQANMKSLYNKVGLLKRIDQKYAKPAKSRIKKETVSYQEAEIKFKENRSKTFVHNLGTETIKSVKVVDSKGKDIKGEWEVLGKKKLKFKSLEETNDAQITITGELEKRENPLVFIAENTALLLMSIKNVSGSYQLTEGTSLSGYLPKTNLLGMEVYNNGDPSKDNVNAPGWPFVLGWQDRNFASKAIENMWFTDDSTLNTPYIMTSNENLNFRINLEPFKGFKIDLTANRTYTENTNQYYEPNNRVPINEQITGNFSISYITIGTAFEDLKQDDNYYSQAFEDFKKYRSDISQRLGEKNNRSIIDGYADGYNSSSQQVMGPAFLAAYGVYDSESVPLDIFQKIPLPNWSIRFDRLKEIAIIKKLFKSFNLSHAYRSSYNVGSFINNSSFEEGQFLTDSLGNVIPMYDMSSITIDERFSPLINVDMTWINNLTTRFEMKKTRSITMSFANNQITEVYSDEMGFSIGYRFDDFEYLFNFGDGENDFKSDLNIRANLKIRNNKTILRKIEEDLETPSADQRVTIIGVSMDYLLSNRLTLRLFYDQNITDPLVGTSPYRISNTDVGFSLRFTLSE